MISADETVFFWINGLAGRVDWIDNVIRVLSCDVFIPLVMFGSLLIIWFAGRDPERRERNQRGVLCSLASMGLANLVVFLLNGILPDRLRPFEAFPGQVNLIFYPPTDPSFPSNAAAAAFALAIGMWVYNRKLGYILLIPALIISFGRIYVGVHYPMDIFGGFACAAAGTIIAVLAMKLCRPIIDWLLRFMRKLYLA